MKSESVEVTVGGRELRLTSLEKVMYPATGFTKAQVIDYYRRVAPAMLPHLKGRPLTRKRYPHGVGDAFFFEKNKPMGTPSWVRVERVTHKGDAIDFVVCDDVATLIWLANLNALELHPQLHLAKDPDRPTHIVFDLDPGLPAALLECAALAVEVRDILADLGLKCCVKTSGGKGLQVYAPLNTPCTYDDTKAFAQAIARLLERQRPEAVVSKMSKELRKGKVFVDWSQNDQVKTTVAAYSLRAVEEPRAGAPLAWDEVEAAVEAEDAEPLRFSPEDLLARVEEKGDLFAPVVKLKQKLPRLG